MISGGHIGLGNELSLLPLHSVETALSVTAIVKTEGDKVVVAAGFEEPNMPLESIKTVGDDDTFTAGYTGNKHGIFLKLDFTWCGTTPTGYYNVAVASFARGLGCASSLFSA